MINSLEAMLERFHRDGVAVISAVIDATMVAKLHSELCSAIEQDLQSYPNVFDAGMVHNCMFRGQQMASLLDCEEMNEFVAQILSPTFIVYAYQSSSLSPSSGNYGSRVHVDSPRLIPGYVTNLGAIFPLNDFTLDNGATYYLPGSQNLEQPPTDEEFYESAKRIEAKAGDLILFHGRVYHAAGINNTEHSRHSLTINFCRSYMRQRFDYPRMMNQQNIEQFSDNTKKLMGWNVRVPTHLDQFYLPESERLYKPNQG